MSLKWKKKRQTTTELLESIKWMLWHLPFSLQLKNKNGETAEITTSKPCGQSPVSPICKVNFAGLYDSHSSKSVLSFSKIWQGNGQQAEQKHTPEIMHVYTHSLRDVHTNGDSEGTHMHAYTHACWCHWAGVGITVKRWHVGHRAAQNMQRENWKDWHIECWQRVDIRQEAENLQLMHVLKAPLGTNKEVDSSLIWSRQHHMLPLMFCYRYVSLIRKRLGRRGGGHDTTTRTN